MNTSLSSGSSSFSSDYILNASEKSLSNIGPSTAEEWADAASVRSEQQSDLCCFISLALKNCVVGYYLHLIAPGIFDVFLAADAGNLSTNEVLPELSVEIAVCLPSLWAKRLSLLWQEPASFSVLGRMQVSFRESLSPAYICLTDS